MESKPDLGSIIRTRRSVHEYTDEDVSRETLESIFETVRFAPSSYNLQPWEFLVLRDDENRERLKECAYGQSQITDASAAVVVLGNLDPAAHAEAVFEDWLQKGYLPDADVRDDLVEMVEGWRERPDEVNRLWTTKSTALAGMTVMLSAWQEGVASCPMGGFDAEQVRSEFGIEGYEPVMLITLGYPDESCDDLQNERKYRRPVEDILHYDEFDP